MVSSVRAVYNAYRILMFVADPFLYCPLLQHVKHKRADFGRCPRVFCTGQPCLPVGISDSPRNGLVKIFCPKCEDLYLPRCKYQSGILFLMSVLLYLVCSTSILSLAFGIGFILWFLAFIMFEWFTHIWLSRKILLLWGEKIYAVLPLWFQDKIKIRFLHLGKHQASAPPLCMFFLDIFLPPQTWMVPTWGQPFLIFIWWPFLPLNQPSLLRATSPGSLDSSSARTPPGELHTPLPSLEVWTYQVGEKREGGREDRLLPSLCGGEWLPPLGCLFCSTSKCHFVM